MDFKEKNIAVIGLGLSGQAAVRYLHLRGANISVMDLKPEAELSDIIRSLGDIKVKMYAGSNDIQAISDADAVILSPGISPDMPGLNDLKKKGIPVLSEMELASLEITKPIIAVTGTNGKTTTTSLIGHILDNCGVKNVVAGNIGTPILDMIDEANSSEVVVLEVSSFQIETSPSLKTSISILLNITPDHIDRHGSLKEYVRWKVELLNRVSEDGIGIFNISDEIICDFLDCKTKRLIPFDTYGKRTSDSEGEAAWFDGEYCFVKMKGFDLRKYRFSDISLKGAHNVENVLSALLAVQFCGVGEEDIKKSLKTFKGLPHRVEFAGEIDGVSYFNDSKGTNVGAVNKALEQFLEPVILIAGGQNKGVEFKGLRDAVSKKVKLLVLIGESAEKIKNDLSGCTESVIVSTMDEAIKTAKDASTKGDVILLSPACASFDMFKNYADRGDSFKRVVKNLRDR